MTTRFINCVLDITRQDVPGLVPGFRLIVRAKDADDAPLHLFVFQNELVNPGESTVDSRFQAFFIGVCSSLDYQELVVGAPAEGQEEIIGAKYRFHEIDIQLPSGTAREQAVTRIIQRVRELVRAHQAYTQDPPGATQEVQIP
jgi:hypothetical protein